MLFVCIATTAMLLPSARQPVHQSRTSTIRCDEVQQRTLPAGWSKCQLLLLPFRFAALIESQRRLASLFALQRRSSTRNRASRIITIRSRVRRNGRSRWVANLMRLVMARSKRSLTPECKWGLKMDLTAPRTSGKYASVTTTVRFSEEDGFEPPQGFMTVDSCLPGGTLTLGQQKTRWLLSEDPEDRKDSLWIWGLFKEPLYPFILFELELAEPLEICDGVAIPAGTLYFQVNHRRKDGEVKLGEGTICYKVASEQGADLLGLSDFTYNEPCSLRYMPLCGMRFESGSCLVRHASPNSGTCASHPPGTPGHTVPRPRMPCGERVSLLWRTSHLLVSGYTLYCTRSI